MYPSTEDSYVILRAGESVELWVLCYNPTTNTISLVLYDNYFLSGCSILNTLPVS